MNDPLSKHSERMRPHCPRCDPGVTFWLFLIVLISNWSRRFTERTLSQLEDGSAPIFQTLYNTRDHVNTYCYSESNYSIGYVEKFEKFSNPCVCRKAKITQAKKLAMYPMYGTLLMSHNNSILIWMWKSATRWFKRIWWTLVYSLTEPENHSRIIN